MTAERALEFALDHDGIRGRRALSRTAVVAVMAAAASVIDRPIASLSEVLEAAKKGLGLP